MKLDEKTAVIRLWCAEFIMMHHENSYHTSTMWVGCEYNKVLHASAYNEDRLVNSSYMKLNNYIWEQISRGMI